VSSFLILRSRASDTLIQASTLREDAARLGLDDPVLDVRCPTCRIIRRVGRSRHREEQDTPILGSFIFIRWHNHSTYFAHRIEDKYPFLGVMRLPQGGFAFCSEKEVEEIGELAPIMPVVTAEETPFDYKIGMEVIVNTIGFLKGITGRIVRVKSNGEVVLKIIDNKGWKLSTLLIHVSALKVSECAPVAAQAETSV
jgi:hypothetical protein